MKVTVYTLLVITIYITSRVYGKAPIDSLIFSLAVLLIPACNKMAKDIIKAYKEAPND